VLNTRKRFYVKSLGVEVSNDIVPEDCEFSRQIPDLDSFDLNANCIEIIRVTGFGDEFGYQIHSDRQLLDGLLAIEDARNRKPITPEIALAAEQVGALWTHISCGRSCVIVADGHWVS
jgi:hypothetical protein